MMLLSGKPHFILQNRRKSGFENYIRTNIHDMSVFYVSVYGSELHRIRKVVHGHLPKLK